jgi:hypothetical protein
MAALTLTGAAASAAAFGDEFVAPQMILSSQTYKYGPEAGVGVINPRIVFWFSTLATVWG